MRDTSLDHRERAVDEWRSGHATREPHPVKPIVELLGEPARDRFLRRREDAHRHLILLQQHGVQRRVVRDRNEDERRIEAHRAKRTRRHSMVHTGRIARREDGNARYEASENASERGAVDRHVGQLSWAGSGDGGSAPAGAKEGKSNAIRYEGRNTSRGGTKSPVTPTKRSARSFRRDRVSAARSINAGKPTAAPTRRSTRHLPPNSARRARS